MQSTYDDVMTDLEATRSELESAKAQKQALAREVAAFEQTTKEATREAEAAAASVRQARDEADSERKAGEERIAKLMRTISRLVGAQGSLLTALHAAREDSRALKSTVEMYKTKLNSADGLRTPSFPSQPAGGDVPGSTPPDIPVQGQAAASSTPSPITSPSPAPPEPAQAKPMPPASQSPPVAPADEGWVSSIKGWLLSIWRSVFS
jgi:hypothetical protein